MVTTANYLPAPVLDASYALCERFCRSSLIILNETNGAPIVVATIPDTTDHIIANAARSSLLSMRVPNVFSGRWASVKSENMDLQRDR